jgi:hypothetical protein
MSEQIRSARSSQILLVSARCLGSWCREVQGATLPGRYRVRPSRREGFHLPGQARTPRTSAHSA